MSRIKQKKFGVSNYLEFTNQDNTLATFGFDGTKFSLDKPLSVTGALTATSFTGSFTGAVQPLNASITTTVPTTVAVTEYGDGRDFTTVLTLTNFIIGVPGAAAADKGIGNIVAAFPAGSHLETVSYIDLSLKAAGTAVATDTGLGSVIASGVVSVLSGTATFEDRLTGQTITTAAAGGTAVKALAGATAGIQTGIALNAAASVKNVFLNSAGTWNVNNTGNLTATGTIVLKWTKIA